MRNEVKPRCDCGLKPVANYLALMVPLDYHYFWASSSPSTCSYEMLHCHRHPRSVALVARPHDPLPIRMIMALFIRLIIHLFQLVFLVGTIFFSHTKSVNNVFQPAYQHSRMGPMFQSKPLVALFLIVSLLLH
jgi:hypothetical protein